MSRTWAGLLVVAVLAASAFALVGRSAAPSAASVRTGASGTEWLCRPGLPHDPCTASLKTTVIEGNGSSHLVDYEPAGNPSVDCFYLYPNISHQTTDNANLDIDPQQTAIAELEASPFSRACRVYAPMYREDTGRSSGEGPQEIALASVEAAWRDYLAHYNDGRGVVLIGHSEGSNQLYQLIRTGIDPLPSVRRLLVSAFLIGLDVAEPTNGAGPFQNIPMCRSTAQIGCVISYNAYSGPPPSDTKFGRPPVATAGGFTFQDLCSNPAALAGGSGTLVGLYRTQLPTQDVEGSTTEGVFGSHGPTSNTPWIEYDGGYSARCVASDGSNVLIVRGRPGSPKLVAAPNAAWGLHIDDPNLALGNLVDLVQTEATAYAAAHPAAGST
jgi:Protein of unknown function (DUF3089)